MLNEDILVGGEESGRMTIGTYLPERDGVWIGLTIWDWLAESNRKLSELLDEVQAITGTFVNERLDLELNKNTRNKVLEKCKNKAFISFGEFQITGSDALDGFKYQLGDDQWVMIRASGTEPLIRIYAEAENRERVVAIINAVVNTLNAA
jgi:phosphomannomutase